jgi:hypothetical protein
MEKRFEEFQFEGQDFCTDCLRNFGEAVEIDGGKRQSVVIV